MVKIMHYGNNIILIATSCAASGNDGKDRVGESSYFTRRRFDIHVTAGSKKEDDYTVWN
jgi:hypothetical protein